MPATRVALNVLRSGWCWLTSAYSGSFFPPLTQGFQPSADHRLGLSHQSFQRFNVSLMPIRQQFCIGKSNQLNEVRQSEYCKSFIKKKKTVWLTWLTWRERTFHNEHYECTSCQQHVSQIHCKTSHTFLLNLCLFRVKLLDSGGWRWRAQRENGGWNIYVFEHNLQQNGASIHHQKWPQNDSWALFHW